MPPLDEITMERVMEEFERRCHENMTHAMETEEGLGIEYDEDVVCDVCRSPDGEDNNEMVFCDKCNICVHQVRGQHTHTFSCRRCIDFRLLELSCPPSAFLARRATASRRSQRAAGCVASVPWASCQSASCVRRRGGP